MRKKRKFYIGNQKEENWQSPRCSLCDNFHYENDNRCDCTVCEEIRNCELIRYQKESETKEKIKEWAFDHDYMIEDKAWKALEKIVGEI